MTKIKIILTIVFSTTIMVVSPNNTELCDGRECSGSKDECHNGPISPESDIGILGMSGNNFLV